MPLVLFVGVNHHGQTIIFACALVSQEFEENYTWVFSRFIDCMKGVHPGGILTDQCQSIEKGMKNVLVGTVHRYCAWHIMRKLPMKWGRKPNKDRLTEQVKYVVYGSVTKKEFEDRWGELMNKLGYEDDSWFNELFQMRDRWVPVFLNSRFWAGMTTTQRVEGMNGLLKKFLTNKTSLGDFVLQFDTALLSLWENENDADHDSKYKNPNLLTCLPMEK
jgi:zinc finger SWIM domain-containing protein 3